MGTAGTIFTNHIRKIPLIESFDSNQHITVIVIDRLSLIVGKSNFIVNTACADGFSTIEYNSKAIAVDCKTIAVDRKAIAVDCKAIAVDCKANADDHKTNAVDCEAIADYCETFAVDCKTFADYSKAIAVDCKAFAVDCNSSDNSYRFIFGSNKHKYNLLNSSDYGITC
jgi:hypothetical protein